MTTSVIIVNFRTAGLTELAARSALADGAAEIVIVDNASGDGSVDRLRRIGERVRVVERGTNGGFGTAANAGAAEAVGDVVLFLNSDARLRPGALATLADAALSGPFLVGPRLIGADGEVQRSAGLVPKPDDLVLRGLGLHHVARAMARLPVVGRLVGSSRIAAEYDLAVTADRPIDVSMVSGACMAIPRSASSALGGFDEHYFMYFEDADLCRRARRAGIRVRYVPTALVDHVGGASSRGDYRFGPWHAASMVRYLRAWHGGPGTLAALGILWLRAVGQALLLRPSAGRALEAFTAGARVARGGRRR